jgi:biopolymer transport protein ExbD
MPPMSESSNIELPKRKRNPQDGELDITPMIDVTFLLLAFFVVVSRMDPQAAVDLPLASYGFSIPDKNCVTLVVTIDDAGEGFDCFLGRSMKADTRVPDGDPEDQETYIGDYVENELSRHPQKSAILIKAEGDVKYGAVELVKRGIAQSELAKTRKIHIGVNEEQ